jgi:hypothetical protein
MAQGSSSAQVQSCAYFYLISTVVFSIQHPGSIVVLIDFHYYLFDPSSWADLGVSMPLEEGMLSLTSLEAKAGIDPSCCWPSNSIAASEEDLCSAT